MRALILVATAALALSACSREEAADNTMNIDDPMMTTNEVLANDMMTTDMNTVDANMTMDANTTTDTTTDMNAVDANTTNAQ